MTALGLSYAAPPKSEFTLTLEPRKPLPHPTLRRVHILTLIVPSLHMYLTVHHHRCAPLMTVCADAMVAHIRRAWQAAAGGTDPETQAHATPASRHPQVSLRSACGTVVL